MGWFLLVLLLCLRYVVVVVVWLWWWVIKHHFHTSKPSFSHLPHFHQALTVLGTPPSPSPPLASLSTSSPQRSGSVVRGKKKARRLALEGGGGGSEVRKGEKVKDRFVLVLLFAFGSAIWFY